MTPRTTTQRQIRRERMADFYQRPAQFDREIVPAVRDFGASTRRNRLLLWQREQRRRSARAQQRLVEEEEALRRHPFAAAWARLTDWRLTHA